MERVSGVPLVKIAQGGQGSVSVGGQSAGKRRAVSIFQSVCISTLCKSGPVNDDLRYCPMGEVRKEEKSEASANPEHRSLSIRAREENNVRACSGYTHSFVDRVRGL